MEIQETNGKKTLLIIGVIAAGIMAIAAVILLPFLNKTAASPEQFIAAVEERGLDWEENIESFHPEDQVYLEAGLYAYTDGWQIEFYQLTSTSSAAGYFSSVADAFDQEVRSPQSYATVNVGGYSSYALTAHNGSYYFTACIDRTVILAVADRGYKDSVKEIVKALGY